MRITTLRAKQTSLAIRKAHVQAYQASGKTIAQYSNRVGLNSCTFGVWVANYRNDKRPSQPRIVQNAHAQAFRASGLSQTAYASQNGVSQPTMSRWTNLK